MSSIVLTRFATACSIMNRALLVVPIVILALLLFGLLSNASHGFDITDESFYLLWANHPEHVQASITQFGYYTKLLFVLSGKNIAIFRISGLLVLLGIAGFFSIALEQYWMKLSDSVLTVRCRWQAIILILTGTLVYYKDWLITPSYNWLALISVLLTSTGLLRAAAREIKYPSVNRFEIRLVIDGFLVGVGGGLAFMAKPTTALFLAAITLYWVLTHHLRNRWKSFGGIALLTAFSILSLHAMIFKGGFIPFYVELRDGMNLGEILGGGHSIGNVFFRAVYDVKQLPARVFALTSVGFLLSPFILCVVWWTKDRGRETLARGILAPFLIIFFLTASYQLWDTGQWSRYGMGFSGLSFLIVLMSFAVMTLLAWNGKGYGISRISFLRLAGLCLFLFMLAAAYAFGSANIFIRQMSAAYVFFIAGALYTAFWIDQHVERDILGYVIPAVIAVSILFVSIDAFHRPYRLPRKISEQNTEVAFLSGSGTLLVDSPTAGYVNELKRLALEAGWIPGTPLIDLTGGSPGATVILGGQMMGFPWLVGGYKGSSEFVKAILEKLPKSKQRSAWILTSPKGKRRIPSEILLDLGLDFSHGYKAIGKITTGHRNETQILWKPSS